MNAVPTPKPFDPMSEAGFRKIFDEGPLGMAVFGPDYRFVQVNARLCRMLGYPRDELTRLTLGDITHPQDLDKDRIAGLLAGRTSDYSSEKRLVKKNGDALWVNLTATAIKDETGRPLYGLATVEDITERKAAEALLRESEERFRTVAESAPDAVIGCRKVGTEVAFWNKAAEKMFGYSKDEIMGQPLAWIMPERLRERHYKGVEGYLATGETTYLGGTAEFTALRKDKSEFPIEISLGTWSGREGLSFTAVIRDITVRKRQEGLSQALNDINASINATLDFDEIVSRVVVAAGAAVGSETTVISLYEAGRWKVAHVGGPLKNLISGRFAEDSASIAALAARLQRPIVVDDIQADRRVGRQFADTYGLRAIIVAPLVLREEVIGSLMFNYHSAPVDFADAEIDFAEKLGSSISLAVENARLYQAQSDIANILQEALITVPEKLPGVDVAYSYRSATEAARVGGDFYDIFELEHDKLGILIGDVSGKGVEAATLTTIVKNTIKAYAFQGDKPAEMLAKTNTVISRASGPADFVTLIYLVLDTQTGELTYCNAGHPPPMVRNRAGTRLLSAHSMVAGIFPEADFAEATDRLDPGDLLILYTDGIIEAKREGELFGEKRLVESVKKARSPEKAVKAILDEVIEFSGDNLLDDTAILALALKPPK